MVEKGEPAVVELGGDVKDQQAELSYASCHSNGCALFRMMMIVDCTAAAVRGPPAVAEDSVVAAVQFAAVRSY